MHLLVFLLSCLLVLLFLEGSCAAFFTLFHDRFTFADPKVFVLEESKLKKAKTAFHAEYGWMRYYKTPFGERPRGEQYQRPLLATYGDSYTHCDQVQHAETYQTFLGRRLQADVYNFGVGGFGTGQALLRFQREFPQLNTPLVALGFITENINRVVNVYRKYYYPKTALSIPKPRFILKDDSLTLLPNPIANKEDLKKLLDPTFVRSLGEHDYWYQKEHNYPLLQFPYSKILFNANLWRELQYQRTASVNDVTPRPWEDLWQEEKARGIMFRLFDRFAQRSKELGSIPLFFLMPRKEEIRARIHGEVLPDALLISNFFDQRNYYYFDAIDYFASIVSEEELSSLYNGHLSPKGNKLLARGLHKFLKEKGLLRKVGVYGPRLYKQQRQQVLETKPVGDALE